MPATELSLPDRLRYLLGLFETKNLAVAARILGTNKEVLLQTIDLLEHHFETILFDIKGDGLSATCTGEAVHRYLIERTFPAGALDGLDAATKAKVNANNASVGVNWVKSFANADRTKTYCVYEGPSEDAIRQAATLNGLPIDRITEVPVDLTP